MTLELPGKLVQASKLQEEEGLARAAVHGHRQPGCHRRMPGSLILSCRQHRLGGWFCPSWLWLLVTLVWTRAMCALLPAGQAFWPLRCHKMCLSLRNRPWQVQVLLKSPFSEELFVAKPLGGRRLGLGTSWLLLSFTLGPSTNCIILRLSETSPLSLENGAEVEKN